MDVVSVAGLRFASQLVNGHLHFHLTDQKEEAESEEDDDNPCLVVPTLTRRRRGVTFSYQIHLTL